MTSGISHCAVRRSVLALAIALALLVSYPARGQQKVLPGYRLAVPQETILYNFTGTPDGAGPYAGLIMDTVGNLYGTTSQGGEVNSVCVWGCGTVVELSPQSGGGWTEQVLYSFKGGAQDGSVPAAGLIFDTAGNLYGITANGGNNNCCGDVFELSPQSGGGWGETVLHFFRNNGKDGHGPEAGLIFDMGGNLCGDDLDVSEDGVGVARLKFAEQFAIVFTELQMNLLYQIVDGGRRCFSPAAGNSNSDTRNHRMEPTDKLFPDSLVSKINAGHDQILSREARVSIHKILRFISRNVLYL
jgi:hypothetical protein